MTMNEYTRLNLILKDLQLMQKREDEKHIMDHDLTFQTTEILDEIVDLLKNELDAYEEGYQ
tara:strand:- start:90 stop:272 length:183 start_codon:yes stop_codon:yes gene_type:complete